MPPEDTPDDYMTSEEYHQGYMDAHPFNQDCELCSGRGFYCYDELTMRDEPCPDCNPKGLDRPDDPLPGEQAREGGSDG